MLTAAGQLAPQLPAHEWLFRFDFHRAEELRRHEVEASEEIDSHDRRRRVVRRHSVVRLSGGMIACRERVDVAEHGLLGTGKLAAEFPVVERQDLLVRDSNTPADADVLVPFVWALREDGGPKNCQLASPGVDSAVVPKARTETEVAAPKRRIVGHRAKNVCHFPVGFVAVPDVAQLFGNVFAGGKWKARHADLQAGLSASVRAYRRRNGSASLRRVARRQFVAMIVATAHVPIAAVLR